MFPSYRIIVVRVSRRLDQIADSVRSRDEGPSNPLPDGIADRYCGVGFPGGVAGDFVERERDAASGFDVHGALETTLDRAARGSCPLLHTTRRSIPRRASLSSS